MSFKRLLIANRGEIACRIARSAHRLGMTCIAVYSDADAGARHVREADEARHLGPAPARDSYLNIGKVLACARASGAQAVHPGYGFLAESAEFARACQAAGLIWVGPSPEAIAALGSKSLARARARTLGIPVLPGYEGGDQTLDALRHEALQLGFPLIIKPAAGGGGKGMQVVSGEAGLTHALTSSRRLAESSFGEGTLVLERYLPAPRHIEVQILADAHGHVLHLGDRDCSLQRRHQKVLEEAPAPHLPAGVREAMHIAAVRLAREVGYVSAGTVEFLLEDERFHFLEMNTRLQVEHPVTEAITGLDLVEWQLRIARGEPLTLAQEDVHFRGAAMEARVCAEDPDRDFLPSAGPLALMEWPQGTDTALRVDAGFDTGDPVPDTYDSLLGKLIVWAPTREQAREQLARALDQTHCVGVRSNERWLAHLVRDARFAAVTHSVAFLGQHTQELQKHPPADAGVLALAALVAHAHPAELSAGESTLKAHASPARSPWEICDAFTPNLPATLTYPFVEGRVPRTTGLTFSRGDPVSLTVDAQAPQTLGHVRVTPTHVSAQLEDRYLSARYFVTHGHIHLWTGGAHHEIGLEDPDTQEEGGSVGEQRLTTPLPGVLVSVAVQVGQRVAAGDVLMVLEAMKMEHAIKAPYDGTVQALHFAVGDRVKEDSELLRLVPMEPG